MPRKIWMDSGAFSAFTLGEKQDLGAYCTWLKRHERHIDHYAVLDVIGDARGTWDNQVEMEKRGTKPVPCFHYGEDPKWLVRYLDRYPYIALGGMVPISTKDLYPWLDEMFSQYLTDSSGAPRVRIHGFGLTTFELMDRYPWYSVDSSSWLKAAHFGLVLMYHEGKMLRINISRKSGRTGDKGQHFFTETPANQAALRKNIEAHGFTVDGLADHYQLRDEFSCVMYMDYAKRWRLRPFRLAQLSLGGLLGTPENDARRPIAPWDTLEVYFAGEVTLEVEGRLYRRGASRMFSYHYLKDRASNNWKAVTGCIDGQPFPPTSNCEEDTDDSATH